MTRNDLKWCAIGAGIGAALLSLIAAVPSQTDFDPAYFRTNALPVTLVAPWTNFPSSTAPQGVQLAIGSNFQIFTNAAIQVGTGASNFFGVYPGLIYSAYLDGALPENDSSGYWEIAIRGVDSTHTGFFSLGINGAPNGGNFSVTRNDGVTSDSITFVTGNNGPYLALTDASTYQSLLDPNATQGEGASYKFQQESTDTAMHTVWKRSTGGIIASIEPGGGASFGRTNAWKTGPIVTGVAGLTLVTTNYLEIVVDGVTNKVALVK